MISKLVIYLVSNESQRISVQFLVVEASFVAINMRRSILPVIIPPLGFHIFLGLPEPLKLQQKYEKSVHSPTLKQLKWCHNYM